MFHVKHRLTDKEGIIPMKSMPSLVVWLMRVAVGSMLAVVGWWEDRNADRLDYRMSELNSALWRASQSLKQIAEGEFQPMRRQFRPPGRMPQKARVAHRDQRDLLAGVPSQLRQGD